jgi:hypothetical protein
MRKVANIARPTCEFRRAMICGPADDGFYLFLFRSADDGPCNADYWYEDAVSAEQHAATEFGIGASDWSPVPDPLPECQLDWLAPVKRVRRWWGLLPPKLVRMTD